MSGLWGCLMLLFLGLTGTLSQRDEWCESDHDHEGEEGEEGLPHGEDFLLEIFHMFGDNTTCRILEEEFEQLLSRLSIGVAGSSGGDDGHDHRRKRSFHGDSHIRRKRDVDTTCYTAENILDVYNISHEVGISQAEFVTMAPALIQQIVQGCNKSSEEEHEEEENDSITSAQSWGYGFLSVLIVSTCSVFGLVIVRWQHKPAYKYIMTVMLGLALGTLVADALMHLIPHGLGLHDHSEDDGHAHDEDEEGIVVEEFVWKTFLACLMIWGFLNLQILLLAVLQKPYNKGDKKVQPSPHDIGESSEKKGGSTTDLENASTKDTDPLQIDQVKAPVSMGWMIAIGDGVHNFADGLAIGAAYTISWQTGLATTIAVFCHELAHEFGDIAAMLSVGWSWKRVLLIQLVSQSTAFLGLFIGIPVAENSDSAEQWILMLAAGMFLFVALSDIVPELMEFFNVYNRCFILIAANSGIALGYFIMLLIAIFEEHIEV